MAATTARAGILALALGTVLLAGCGTQVAGSSSTVPAGLDGSPSSSPGATTASDLPAPAPSVSSVSRCPLPVADQAALPRLTAGTDPVAVVVCTTTSRIVPGEGEWEFVQERRADHGLDALVAALRAPDAPVPADLACPLNLIAVAPFALVDATGALHQYAVPQTACRDPQPAVLRALDSLPLVTVAETKVRQYRTAERVALDAQAEALGCVGSYKDMMAIETADGSVRLGAGGSPYPSAPASLGLCRYSPDPADSQVGKFVSGERLTGARLREVLTALRASTPGRACTAAHSGFVALVDPHGGYVLVETDGCRRVLTDRTSGAVTTSTFDQGSPALAAALTG